MNMKQLPISESSKAILTTMGYTTEESLKTQKYFTQKRKEYSGFEKLALLTECNPLGYLLPETPEIMVTELPLNRRVQQGLLKYIVYLSELCDYRKQEILALRGIGEVSIKKLEALCEENQIVFQPELTYSKEIRYLHMDGRIKQAWAKAGIQSLTYFSGKTTKELYLCCNKNYYLSSRIYKKAREKGISFATWEDRFLFECLPEYYVILFYQRCQIIYLSQLQKKKTERRL